MGLYRRYTKDLPAGDDGFKLDADNIGLYRQYCISMDGELRSLKSYIEVLERLDDVSKQDYLYTPEYLQGRLEKLRNKITIDGDSERYISTKKELDQVNEEIRVVLPQVMDKVTGRDPALHERMSVLNDRCKQLEDTLVELISRKYPELRTNLPRIFFMILDGVDMETVLRCFDNMSKILGGTLTVEGGAEDLMDFTQRKYNLPKTMYDPIRKGGAKGPKKGGKGSKK